MALTKETRIKIFIAVDLAFFFLEITLGYAAHSLALVADAFHMLNDVISLFVGLWAVKAATERGSDNQYTYGWARAELLGGLVNGVFLLALCMTIVLEAIQRFFEPQEVKNPKLVLIVGGVGLVFNILGLFVFHQHSHGHDHDEEAAHDHDHEHAHDALDAAGNGHIHKHSHAVDANGQEAAAPKHIHRPSTASRKKRNSRSYSTIDDLPIHPASVRNEILGFARAIENDGDDEAVEPSEFTSLLGSHGHAHTRSHSSTHHDHTDADATLDHSTHAHAQPRKPGSGGGGGHSHHDMNMRGMFLHVLGDALGNVGVMASALIIWLTPWSFKQYFDPAISLFITLIILKSAIPLCKDTARPLLQAVPSHVSVEDIKADIETLPGVRSCHHVHVWALTPSKIVATLDVEVDFSIGTVVGASGREKWMALGREIKSCLHGHGIHSSTIQPEFCVDEEGRLSRKGSQIHTSDANEDCLLVCKDVCKTGKQCCDPVPISKAGSKSGSGSNSPR